MGGVRGSAAPIARPGSSLSCILNRELTVESLSSPGLLPTSLPTDYKTFSPTPPTPTPGRGWKLPEISGGSFSRAAALPQRMTIFSAVSLLPGKDLASYWLRACAQKGL